MQIFFNANPQVQLNIAVNIQQAVDIAVNHAAVSAIEGLATVHSTTFDDDDSAQVTVSTQLSDMPTVLYSASSSVGNEKGIIRIAKTDSGYDTTTMRLADDSEFLEQLEFSAEAVSGNLKLQITGSGAGASTTFKYRLSPFNSLGHTL